MSQIIKIKRIRHSSNEEYLRANVGDQNDSHQQIFQVPADWWSRYVELSDQLLELEIRMDQMCADQEVPMT